MLLLRAGVVDIGLHLLNPKLPLANPEPPKQRTEIPIDPKLLDNYTGRYQLTPNLIFEITRDGDRLFAQGFAQVTRSARHRRCLSLNCLPKARRTSSPGCLTTRSPLKLARRAEPRALFCTEPAATCPPPPDYPDSHVRSIWQRSERSGDRHRIAEVGIRCLSPDFPARADRRAGAPPCGILRLRVNVGSGKASCSANRALRESSSAHCRRRSDDRRGSSR